MCGKVVFKIAWSAQTNLARFIIFKDDVPVCQVLLISNSARSLPGHIKPMKLEYRVTSTSGTPLVEWKAMRGLSKATYSFEPSDRATRSEEHGGNHEGEKARKELGLVQYAIEHSVATVIPYTRGEQKQLGDAARGRS